VATTATTARIYNHDPYLLYQFVQFSARRFGDGCWGRFEGFWDHNPADRRHANRSNSGARQHISEHRAATHVHVSAPFLKTPAKVQNHNAETARRISSTCNWDSRTDLSAPLSR
jgi:hypothetical protein